MEAQYRRKPDQTCLVFGKESSPDPYTLRVLEENRIPGVLEMKMISVNQKDEFHFVVTGYQPLTRLWEKQQISITDIYLVLNGIYRIAKTLEDYLIDASHIVLKPEYIFVKKDVLEIYLCCHPGYNGDFYAQIRELAQYFINKIDHSDREGTRRAYEIYRITGEEFFGYEELLDMARSDTEDSEQTDGLKAEETSSESNNDGWDDAPAPAFKGKEDSSGNLGAVSQAEEDMDNRYAILGLRGPEMAATLIACACVGFGVYFFVRRGSLQKGCMMLAASFAIFIMIIIERIISNKERTSEEDRIYRTDNEQYDDSMQLSGQMRVNGFGHAPQDVSERRPQDVTGGTMGGMTSSATRNASSSMPQSMSSSTSRSIASSKMDGMTSNISQSMSSSDMRGMSSGTADSPESNMSRSMLSGTMGGMTSSATRSTTSGTTSGVAREATESYQPYTEQFGMGDDEPCGRPDVGEQYTGYSDGYGYDSSNQAVTMSAARSAMSSVARSAMSSVAPSAMSYAASPAMSTAAPSTARSAMSTAVPSAMPSTARSAMSSAAPSATSSAASSAIQSAASPAMPSSTPSAASSVDTAGNHFLIRKDSDIPEGIRLWRLPFVMGSMKENSDWLLGSQDAGIVQVRLEEISGDYYLADMGSSKGLSINGIPIQPYRRCQIKEGDEILIAGLRYVFQ